MSTKGKIDEETQGVVSCALTWKPRGEICVENNKMDKGKSKNAKI